MEPDLQLLSENSSLLLEGTDPNEDTTKSFEANLADEKKRYQDTLESARTMSDLFKSGLVHKYCYSLPCMHLHTFGVLKEIALPNNHYTAKKLG